VPEETTASGDSLGASQARPVRWRRGLPAVIVFVLVALTGLLVGAVWSLLAPPIMAQVSDGSLVPSMTTVYHFFDPVADFVLIGFVAGLLSGVALWLFRRGRGPLILLVAVAGSLAAGVLAIEFGSWLTLLEHPLSAMSKPGASIALPPEPPTWWAILAQPLGLAISYGILASWNVLDDLGSQPEVPAGTAG
jgi:hypothetical protein